MLLPSEDDVEQAHLELKFTGVCLSLIDEVLLNDSNVLKVRALSRANSTSLVHIDSLSKELARFGEGAPRSDCPTVPCTTPETVYDHATPRPTTYTCTWPSYYARALPLGQGYEQQRSKKRCRRSPSR